MRYRIDYEWNLMDVDPEWDDIIENEFAAKLSEYSQRASELTEAIRGNPRYKLELVLRFWNEESGVIEVAYAAVADGSLEAEFENGHTVPKRFAKELAGRI